MRQGFRPWLGYAPADGADETILLHRKGGTASITPDGAVRFVGAAAPGAKGDQVLVVAAGDAVSFDALFPPDAPNRRNLVRRLYEIGVGAW